MIKKLKLISLVSIIFLSSYCGRTQMINSKACYTIRLQEHILSDYNNLLDSNLTRKYNEYKTNREFNVCVKPVSNNTMLFCIHFDSVRGKDSQSPILDRKIEFLHRFESTNSVQSSLYFDAVPSPDILNYVKIVVSSIQFLYTGRFLQEYALEPFVDGLYNVRYSVLKEDEKTIEINKEKLPVYKPGINAFRNIIDSFAAHYRFEKQGALLRHAQIFEKKKQKLGNRTLSKVVTKIDVAVNNSSDVLYNNADPGLSVFNICIPVYKQLSYAERMSRISNDTSGNISSVDELINDLKNIDESNFYKLSARVRSSVITGTLKVNQISLLLDSFPFRSAKYKILEDALLEAGTIETQNVLAKILNKQNETDFFYKSLLIKIGVTAPVISETLLNKLFQLRSDTSNISISRTAGLALSNNAYLLASDGKQNSRMVIIEKLFEEFKKSVKIRSDTLQWLQESGNAANELIVSLVKNCVYGKDKELQKEAIYALRFIQGGDVDSLLAGQINAQMQDQLPDVLKLRYPSAVIRQSIYNFIAAASEGDQKNVDQFIDYLTIWKEDIHTVMNELKSAILQNPKLIGKLN
jgi:hypothetical protein